MANTVFKQILSEGKSKILLYVYLESDGNEGELTNYVLFDPVSEATPTLDVTTQLSVVQVWYSFNWFTLKLSFDDLVPYPSWVLVPDEDGYKDFRYFGGLKDRAGLDHTSKLLISTSGFAPLASNGSMVIELRKD
jgi:hypothetical protein